MKTMAPDAPTSQTSARCKASTPGAAVTAGSEFSAVAAYAITHSRKRYKRPYRHCEERSDEAIHLPTYVGVDCFASLAMTSFQNLSKRSRSSKSAPTAS